MPSLDVAKNPWAPNEPESNIIKERAILAGIGLGLAAWGILLSLAVQCAHALFPLARRERIKAALLGYVLLMFSLGTAAEFCHLHWVQTFMIDNRNYPGGPLAYDKAFYSSAISIVGDVGEFMMNWLADGLLIVRLYIIYGRRWRWAALPFMMYLTSFSLSIVELHTVGSPGSSKFTPSAVKFGDLYWSFSVALNVLVTSLIVGRLLLMRARISRVAGSQHAQLYYGISAMLIESAALYSLPAIAFVVGYSLQSPLQFAVEPVEMLQGVAPLMIILRVARGTAINDTTGNASATVSAIRFDRNTRSTTTANPTNSSSENTAGSPKLRSMQWFKASQGGDQSSIGLAEIGTVENDAKPIDADV